MIEIKERIPYKNFALDNAQAHGVRKVLVNKCVDIINGSKYFSSNNLTSYRVFNDCIAYINFFFTQ